MPYRSVVAGLVAVLALGVPAPTVAQQVTVTVNGQALYLSPGPIERAGRVFVPLRGIFERLGAGVVYSAGTINATKDSTTVSLHIGLTQATVNGQAQILDVAPFIIGATTYVPLRFIAQSLGANVGYDASTRVVAIQMEGGAPPPMPAPRPPRPPAPPPMPPPGVRLRAQQPQPDSEIRNRFPVISAEFAPRAVADSVRIWLDGATITLQSGVSSSAFSYKPPAPLSFGSHTVRVAGRGQDGVPFDRAWSFRVLRSAAPSIPLTIYQPSPNAVVGGVFVVQGNTVANGRVRISAGAGPDGTGQFAGTTTAGPRGNFKLSVTLTMLMGQQTVTVRIVVTDPATSATTETTMRLRLNR